MTKGDSQEIVKDVLADLIDRQMKVPCLESKRQPSQIAVAQMISLRTRFAALTLLRTRELLQFAVKLLNRPTPGVYVSNGLRVDGVWTVGDNPVNVAVCGNYLEQSNLERQLFELD